MKLNSTKSLIMFGAVAVGIIGLIAISAMGQGSTTATTSTNLGCLPINVLAALVPSAQVPAYLPSGYEYKCGIIEDGEANMLYWNQTVDKTTYQVDPINAVSNSPGSVLIRVSEVSSITDPASQAKQEYDHIAQTNAKLNVQLLTINGKPAWANDISLNAGTQEARFPDGQVITQNYDVPARLRIFEEGKLIHIEGFIPLSELVKIGESLQ